MPEGRPHPEKRRDTPDHTVTANGHVGNGLHRPHQPSVRRYWGEVYLHRCRLFFAIPVRESSGQCYHAINYGRHPESHRAGVCWPRSIYSDNGTHFTGGEIQTMFRNFGVTHFHAAISHPSSVGLAERYVQMTVGRLRLKCIDCKDASHWGLLVRDAILDINTRCIRIHGYTPAEILLGYNPATSRVRQCETAEDWLKEGLNPEDVLHPGLDEMNWHITSREGNGDRVTQRLAREQHRLESRAHPPSGTYGKPKAGDPVLLRDLARDQQHGRKLDPPWSEPRIVDRISKTGLAHTTGRFMTHRPERRDTISTTFEYTFLGPLDRQPVYLQRTVEENPRSKPP